MSRIDINPGSASAVPTDFEIFNNELYFNARTGPDSNTIQRLYKLDVNDVVTLATNPDGVRARFAIAATDATKLEGNVGTTAYTFTITLARRRDGSDPDRSARNDGFRDDARAGQRQLHRDGHRRQPGQRGRLRRCLPSGTVTFAPGQTSQVVTINVSGDTTVEANETFTVTLSGASGALIGTATAIGTIINDDVVPPPPSLAIAPTDAIKLEGDTGTTDFTFTVTRSGDTTGTASVTYAVTGFADAADFGGTLPSGTVTFAAGETSKLITIDVSGDLTVEDNEPFTVTLSNASGASIGTATATGTIWADDFHTVIAFDGEPPYAANYEGDTGTTAFSWTVYRENNTDEAVSVDYAVMGTFADADDFGGTLPSGTVTFAAGETTTVLTIYVSGDLTVEFDEDFTVTLSSENEAIVIAVPTATGIILNDDVAPPASLAIAPTDATKLEGDAGPTAYTFTVTRSGDTTGTSSVNYSVSGGVDAADFGGTLPSGIVTFAAGETSQVVTINVSGDTTVEADEQFTVTLSGASGASIGTATATGTITNDDVLPPPSLAITPTDATKLEGNAGTTAYTFTVTRSGDTTGTSSVTYAVSGGVDAADFGGTLPSAVVNFAAGETTQVVTINVSGDTAVEANEQFTVTLSGASGASIGTATATGTITNDDVAPPPSLAITPTDATRLEGNTGTTAYTFTITRSGDTTGTSSVSYAVTGGVNAADFGGTLPFGTVTFAAGETSQLVTINVSGDTAVETDESFTVTLSGESGATIGTATATGTILNDDVTPPPSLAIAPTDATRLEGNAGPTAYTFTVTRSGDTTGTSSVTYAVTGGVNAADFGGTLPSGTVIFAAGETSQVVTINVSGDTAVEADEQFTVTLSSASWRHDRHRDCDRHHHQRRCPRHRPRSPSHRPTRPDSKATAARRPTPSPSPAAATPPARRASTTRWRAGSTRPTSAVRYRRAPSLSPLARLRKRSPSTCLVTQRSKRTSSSRSPCRAPVAPRSAPRPQPARSPTTMSRRRPRSPSCRPTRPGWKAIPAPRPTPSPLPVAAIRPERLA